MEELDTCVGINIEGLHRQKLILKLWDVPTSPKLKLVSITDSLTLQWLLPMSL